METLMIFAIIIGISLLLLFTVFLFDSEQKMSDKLKNWEIEGRAKEIEHHSWVINAKTCEEKNLLLIQYFNNGYWDKKIYDDAFNDYKTFCIDNKYQKESEK